MIEDPELRALFKAESEEHLQLLETGLLRLEAEPHDSAALEEIFRSAHNLKGAAGMLGVEEVETLAHHFEDELGAVRRGSLTMSAAMADRLYRGLDAMRQLAREASGGEAAQVDVPAVLAQLRGQTLPTATARREESPGDEPVASEATGGRTGPPKVPSAPADETESRAPEMPEDPQALDTPTAFKIETIRVEPQKLDALMTLAGEMNVTTMRVGRTLTVIEDLMTLWEEWGRDATALRSTAVALGNAGTSGAPSASAHHLARFQERETGRLERLGRLLGQLKRTGEEEITRLSAVAGELDESIRSMRLLPFSTLFNLFPRMVRDLSQELKKDVRLVIEGGTVAADKHLLEEMKDPLMHLLRNAIDHGIEPPDARERQGKSRTATVRLRAFQAGTTVVIEITDDGRGLDAEAIRSSALRKRLRSAEELAAMTAEEAQLLIFMPGFSTSPMITDLSGRGVGLDVVRTNIERLKGTITVESVLGHGCTFRLQAPLTLATTHVLLVQVAQRSYALPVEAVQEIVLLASQDIFSLEGRSAVRRDNQPVAVVRLADLLDLPAERSAASGGKAIREPSPRENDLRLCILLTVGMERLGLIVDAALEEQEVILKPFGGLLQRVRNVSGATILSTGEICMVLNPTDLVRSAQKSRTRMPAVESSPQTARKRVVLLAEDSITTRTQEKRILESAGYEVVTAVDGADALKKLPSRPFDAVVSDVEMPNMDGLTLAARIRQEEQYRELPIILVTSLASDADRQRGVDVGANAYITKGTFDQTELLNTLRRLV